VSGSQSSAGAFSDTVGSYRRTNVNGPWETHCHPDCSIYYSHALDSKFRVITYDKSARFSLLESWAKLFHQRAADIGLLRDSDAVIDLYLAFENEHAIPYYYMVNVPAGQVVWLDRQRPLWVEPGENFGAY
jgi:hypothetical protein